MGAGWRGFDSGSRRQNLLQSFGQIVQLEGQEQGDHCSDPGQGPGGRGWEVAVKQRILEFGCILESAIFISLWIRSVAEDKKAAKYVPKRVMQTAQVRSGLKAVLGELVSRLAVRAMGLVNRENEVELGTQMGGLGRWGDQDLVAVGDLSQGVKCLLKCVERGLGGVGNSRSGEPSAEGFVQRGAKGSVFACQSVVLVGWGWGTPECREGTGQLLVGAWGFWWQQEIRQCVEKFSFICINCQ